MQIKLNGDTEKFPENSTIRDIISASALQGETVIVFVNGDMVRSDAWNDAVVSPGDRLEIIKIVGGG